MIGATITDVGIPASLSLRMVSSLKVGVAARATVRRTQQLRTALRLRRGGSVDRAGRRAAAAADGHFGEARAGAASTATTKTAAAGQAQVRLDAHVPLQLGGAAAVVANQWIGGPGVNVLPRGAPAQCVCSPK